MDRNATLTHIFRQHRGALLRFLHSLSLDRELAEDVTQETFLRLLGAPEMTSEEIRCWLYRVARNLALNEHRRRRTHGRILSSLQQWLGWKRRPRDPLQKLDASRTGLRLIAMINLLPTPLRSTLLLREVEGLSYREIAEVLECGEAKVRTDLHRARVRLRAQWQRLEPDHQTKAKQSGPKRVQAS